MYKELMKPNEDWTNVSSSAERRRIQNRIAQRVYRRNMKERTNEVQRLKARISELEGTVREDTNCEAPVNGSPITSPDVPGAAVALAEKQELKTPGSFAAAAGSPSTHNANTSWDHSPEHGGVIALRSLSEPKVAHSLDPPEELSAFTCTESTPKISRSESCIMSGPERQLHPSSTQSGSDESQHKGDTSSFPPPVSPSQCHQYITEGEESPTTLIENGPYLTGNGTLYFGLAQPEATSITDGDDKFLWPGILSPPSHDVHAFESRTPPFPNASHRKSSLPASLARARLLHLAVASGNADTLRLLLQNVEMSTNVRDAAGYTAFERAVLYGRTEIVAILIDHGIDLESDEEASESGNVFDIEYAGSVS